MKNHHTLNKEKDWAWIYAKDRLSMLYLGQFDAQRCFLASNSIGGFKFKSGVSVGVFRECERCTRGKRKAVGHVENLLECLDFEKLLCLKQRKRAALVAKFERSPVNFKFVCSHLKIAVYQVPFQAKVVKISSCCGQKSGRAILKTCRLCEKVCYSRKKTRKKHRKQTFSMLFGLSDKT